MHGLDRKTMEIWASIFAVTQMPHETDSANPSTMSSFKSQAQVIDGQTSAGLYEEVGVKTQSARPVVFLTLVVFFFFFYIYFSSGTQNCPTTAFHQFWKPGWRRRRKICTIYSSLFQTFVVFFHYLFAPNTKKNHTLISQRCKPWPMSHLNTILMKRHHV